MAACAWYDGTQWSAAVSSESIVGARFDVGDDLPLNFMKKFSRRLWIWIALACVGLWILLLSALTQRLNSQTDRSVANELLVPVTARRHHVRASAAVARGEYKAAIEDFERATKLYFRAGDEGARIEYALGIADCCMGRAQAHRALGELNEAVEYYSGSEVVFDTLGFLGDSPVPPATRAMHDYALAVDDFGRAIKIYLSLQRDHSQREQIDLMFADCLIHRGNAYRGVLDLRESVRDYSNGIALCGRVSESDRQETRFLLLARACFNRGLTHAMQGEFAFAFLDFESARNCAMQHAVIAMDRLRGLSLQLLSTFRSLVR
jgi:tetratricopeptide (TPR) repeat protein